MNLEISTLLDTEQFRNMIKQSSGHPNYHNIEKGFEVYENMVFSSLINGNENEIQFPEKDKNLVIGVHYHPNNYVVPSLVDLFNEFVFSFIQNKKGGLIPYFGILSVDNEYRQKGHTNHSILFPELLVYSYKHLILKYGNLSKEEIGFKDLEEGKFAIELKGSSESLLVETNGELIHYEEKIHQNNYLAYIVADELQKKIEVSLTGIRWTFRDSFFDTLFKNLRNVETLDMYCLKKYLNLS